MDPFPAVIKSSNSTIYALDSPKEEGEQPSLDRPAYWMFTKTEKMLEQIHQPWHKLVCSAIKQSKRLFSCIHYRTRTQHWIPNLITEGSGSEMIKDDQDKAEDMANYFGTVFTQKSLLDEKLYPNTKSKMVCSL